MELKINDIQLPEVIQFNYEELKQELSEKVKKYETLVYTDDQIKEAKADKATLNKLKKVLNDERIRRQKEYMQPFEEFKAKVDEIIQIIDKPVALIDKQVKEFDEKRKNEKRLEIGNLWENTEHPEWLRLPQLFDERWLNAGYTMRQISDDMTGWINRINSEMLALEELEEFKFEAISVYKQTLDMSKAIAEGKRMAEIQRRKEEAAKAVKPEEKVEKAEEAAEAAEDDLERTWIAFTACLTVPQALELKEFFKSRKIEFKPL